MKKNWKRLAGLLPALAAAAMALTALSNLEQGNQDEGRRALEDAIRRSAVSCYAAEGVYPPTLAYLEEYYGLQVDASRYAVFYDAVGENLMPDITVVEKGS